MNKVNLKIEGIERYTFIVYTGKKLGWCLSLHTYTKEELDQRAEELKKVGIKFKIQKV